MVLLKQFGKYFLGGDTGFVEDEPGWRLYPVVQRSTLNLPRL